MKDLIMGLTIAILLVVIYYQHKFIKVIKEISDQKTNEIQASDKLIEDFLRED